MDVRRNVAPSHTRVDPSLCCVSTYVAISIGVRSQWGLRSDVSVTQWEFICDVAAFSLNESLIPFVPKNRRLKATLGLCSKVAEGSAVHRYREPVFFFLQSLSILSTTLLPIEKKNISSCETVQPPCNVCLHGTHVATCIVRSYGQALSRIPHDEACHSGRASASIIGMRIRSRRLEPGACTRAFRIVQAARECPILSRSKSSGLSNIKDAINERCDVFSVAVPCLLSRLKRSNAWMIYAARRYHALSQNGSGAKNLPCMNNKRAG